MNEKIIAWLHSLSEAETYPLIRDLLLSMGYERVTITHGPLEIGKDICFMEQDRIGREIWRGVQVKTTLPSGSLSSDAGIRSLVNQCEAAIDTPFTTPNGHEVHLSEVWLVMTHPITENAKLSIKGKLRDSKDLYIIDAALLCDLIEQHLPHLIEAGSKPIESYLKHLTTFCDSPEEYLAVQMRAKWQISDIFVDPLSTIQVVDPSCLAKKSILVRFADFFDKLHYYRTLLTHRLLPLAELYVFSEQTSSLIHLYQSLGKLEGLGAKRKAFGVALTSLLSVATAHDVNIEAPFSLVHFTEQFTPALDLSRLEPLEGALRELDDEAVGILRRYKELQTQVERKRHKALFGSRGEREIIPIYVQLANAAVSRRQFFDSVLSAYNLSIGVSDQWVRIALKVGSMLYDQLALPKDALLSQNAAMLKQFLLDFDSELKGIYNSLWDKGSISTLETRQLDPKNTDVLLILGELNQLTSLVREFYHLADEEAIEYSCEALALCQNLERLVLRGALGVGKTTLLKRFGNISAKKASEDPSQPIPILSILSVTPDVNDRPVEEALLSSTKDASLKLDTAENRRVQWLLSNAARILPPIVGWCLPAMFTWVFTTWRVWRLIKC